MNGVGLRISGDDLHQVVSELGRRAVGRDLGKVPSRFGFNTTEGVSCAAALVFAVAPRDPPRLHRARRANLGVQHHRLFIHADHRFLLRERLFIQCQHVFHARNVLLIQFGDAPAFFPATASDRGSQAGYGWFPGLLAAPDSASPLPRQSVVHSIAPCPPAAGRIPWPQSAGSGPCSGPAPCPDAAFRTRQNPVLPPHNAGLWHALSFALRPHSRPPAPPSARCRAGAKSKLAAALAPTPAPSSASRLPAADPSFPIPHAHEDSVACFNYAGIRDLTKVTTKVHLHTVIDLVRWTFRGSINASRIRRRRGVAALR